MAGPLTRQGSERIKDTIINGLSKDGLCAVTGAGGFIASHLTRMLLERGYRVRALVHYNALNLRGHLDEIEREARENQAEWFCDGRLEVIAGDVQDSRCMRNLVAGCDGVFHLAALIGIPYSYVAPQAYVNINVMGTLNVLEACREEKVGRMLHTSTSEVYGTARTTPISESHPLQGQSPYSASKIAADKLAEAYYCSFALPVVTVRPFNTYGPRQSARAVIPAILSQALDPHCDRIRLGSLDPVRDLTYVEDTARAYIEIAESPLETIAGRLYNLGTGQGINIDDLAHMALKVTATDKPVVADEQRIRPRHSEVFELISDNRRIGGEIGWKPQVTLEEGLRQTAGWIQQHGRLFRTDEYTL